MSGDNDHFYLDRPSQRCLLELLRRIPDLCEELAITLSRQDHISANRYRRRNHDEQPLPYNPDAADAADELHAELATWVCLVREQRRLETPATDTTPALAHWLDRHIVALAMTEGTRESLPGIGAAIERAWRTIAPPARPIVIDEAKVARARKWPFTYSGIVAVATELGEEYRNLTAARMDTLIRTGKITPAPGPWRPDWPSMYILGKVLEAHLSHPIRRRNA